MGRIEIRRKEREADIFATYFLIPEEKLNQILNEEWLKESSNLFSALAEEFHGFNRENLKSICEKTSSQS